MKISSLYCTVAIALGSMIFLTPGCGEDEPSGGGTSHRPSGGGSGTPGQGAGEDPTPGEPGQGDQPGEPENPEAHSPIVGTWDSSDRERRLVFGADGQYSAYTKSRKEEEQDPDPELHSDFEPQDESDFELQERGTYDYNDLKRWLWISLAEESGVRMVEYRCLIDAASMTLISTDGHRTAYTKTIP